MHVLYDQVRVAAAIARGQLALTAAQQLEAPLPKLTLRDGVVTAPDGRCALVWLADERGGRLAHAGRTGAAEAGRAADAGRHPAAADRRARDRTGTKQFAMDLDVPGALPTMVCRPPTINGTALAVLNQAQVSAMSGVTDVAIIPHTQFVPGGVAVRATTFGQCIDAIRALQVQWAPGRRDRQLGRRRAR